MFNIDIKSIPHSEQRYETPGDWYWTKEGVLETLVIRVSEMPDWRYEALVAFHELAEVLICRCMGIKQLDVDAFDIQYEKERAEGKHSQDDEPGDDPACPIQYAHSLATALERALSFALFVNWKEYGDAVVALLPKPTEEHGDHTPQPELPGV